MKAAVHTPAPWTLVEGDDAGNIYVEADFQHIIPIGTTKRFCQQCHANARLIAAAPELADLVHAYLLLMQDDGQTVYALDALHEEMSVVLRKAGYDVPLYLSEV